MDLGIEGSFAKGPICRRVSNGHRSSCLVSHHGRLTTSRYSPPRPWNERTLLSPVASVLFNVVSPPPSSECAGMRHPTPLTMGKGANLVSTFLIVLRIRDAVPSLDTPRALRPLIPKTNLSLSSPPSSPRVRTEHSHGAFRTPPAYEPGGDLLVCFFPNRPGSAS